MIDQIARGQLLHVARNTLDLFLTHREQYIPDETFLSPHLLAPASSFVTLYNQEQLRGCIGSTHGRLPLVHDVMHNTVAAARDPRFKPVRASELPDVRIQISVLHLPRPLKFFTYEDLCDQLRPGIDGVILIWQEQKALLLPQVWERLPEPNTFLQTLCHKAKIPLHVLTAIPPAYEVLTFETTSFSESCEEERMNEALPRSGEAP